MTAEGEATIAVTTAVTGTGIVPVATEAMTATETTTAGVTTVIATATAAAVLIHGTAVTADAATPAAARPPGMLLCQLVCFVVSGSACGSMD